MPINNEGETQTTAVQSAQQSAPQTTDREILEAIYENTRKTKNYMKWSLIITIAFVVIPLVGTIILIPFALRSVTSIYSSNGLINTFTSGYDDETAQNLIEKYTK